MDTSIEQVLEGLSPDRRQRIKEKAKEYIKEYKTLQELRKSLGITQDMIASQQGIKQVNISNLEKRGDMRISTLKKYIESLGCELEIFIRTPDNGIAKIENLLQGGSTD